jgi:hypothetical protein
MPILTELENADHGRFGAEPVPAPTIRSPCARVRIENIIIVLQARFAESVPSDMEERLRKLSEEELDGMVGRIAIAPSIEEAIAISVRKKFE